ncbi:MAG TPA: hypothetical protein PLG43_01570 [Spirochaetia bacterium]|nr:hypothetical protein [Spirochaetia bacterium]
MALYGKDHAGRRGGELVGTGFRLSVLEIILILLVGLSDPVFSQVSHIPLSVDPDPVGRGDRFTLTAIIPVSDTAGVFVDEPRFPEGLRLLTGPYIRPVFIESSPGGQEVDVSREAKVEISFTGTAQRTGMFIIPGFTVRAGNLSFKTVETILSVGIMKNKVLVVPLEVQWKILASRLYEGGVIPIVLQVKNQEKILFCDRIQVTQPADGLFEEVFGLGAVETTQVGAATLYHFPAASFLFIPSRSGGFTLPKAVVEADSISTGQGTLSGEASPLTFSVQPLPPEVRESGAVGKFTYKSTVSSSEVAAGADLVVQLKVEGEGNLGYLRFPEPEVPEGGFLYKKENHDLKVGNLGYTGWREVEYHYGFDTEGVVSIAVPPFSFVDPETDAVHLLPGREYSIRITPQKPGEEDKIPEPPFPFAPEEAGSVRGFSPGEFYTNPTNYLLLVPGPLALFVVFVTRKRKGFLAACVFFLAMARPDIEYAGMFSEGLDAYAKGDLDSAEKAFTGVLSGDEGNPSAYYNRALIRFRKGDIGNAVADVRKALYLAPFRGEYRRFLTFLEEQGNLTSQVAPVFSLYPDIFFFLLVVSVNAAGFMGVLVLSRKKGRFFIGFVLLGIVVLVSLTGLIVTSAGPPKQSGVVVVPDSQFKKIPVPSASDWASLQAGTSIRILGEAEGFYLAETGFGMKGWIDKKQVILDRLDLKTKDEKK